MSEEKYVKKPTHNYTATKYNSFIKMGNYKNEFRELLNNLGALRVKARYLKSPFTLPLEDAQRMMQEARELEKYTLSRIT